MIYRLQALDTLLAMATSLPFRITPVPQSFYEETFGVPVEPLSLLYEPSALSSCVLFRSPRLLHGHAGALWYVRATGTSLFLRR